MSVVEGCSPGALAEWLVVGAPSDWGMPTGATRHLATHALCATACPTSAP